MTRQRRRLLAGALDLERVLVQLIAWVGLSDDRLAIAKDRGKDVVEVVGDPTGESPDGLALLALRQLSLEAMDVLTRLAPL